MGLAQESPTIDGARVTEESLEVRLSDGRSVSVPIAWDKQFEEEVKGGRLDALADEALRDLRAGRCFQCAEAFSPHLPRV